VKCGGVRGELHAAGQFGCVIRVRGSQDRQHGPQHLDVAGVVEGVEGWGVLEAEPDAIERAEA
jgi:hypothetical protein